jgi:hypothetical protein
MVTDRPEGAINRYCQRLRLAPPDLEAALGSADVKLAHLMALALLEAGGPLPLEAIAARLGRLPLPPRLRTADLAASLRKAWHGQPPVVRDGPDGLFYLDLLSDHALRQIARMAGPGREQAAPVGRTDFEPPPDDVPLSEAEVEAAFRDRALGNVSSIRRAVAVLDAWGGAPASLDAVNERLAAWAGPRARIDERTSTTWSSDAVGIRPDGLLEPNPASPDLPVVRRLVRRMASARLRAQADSEAARERRRAYLARREAEQRHDEDEARRARRALVHVVTVDGIARAAAVVDAGSRQLEVFVGERLRELPERLATFDFLAGLDLRFSLRRVGLDPDRWWLAELRPTQRTFRPSDRGPAVPVRLSAIVEATTGRRGVPAGDATWRTLLDGPSGPLARRLADEAQALFALYSYGALQGGVRVQRRPGAWLLPVAWSLAGDPDLRSFIDAASRRWVPVQVVVGPSSDLADPWPGATTLTILDRQDAMLLVRAGEDVRILDPADIRAIRLPDAAAAANVRPASCFTLDDRACRVRVTLEGVDPPVWRRLEVPAFVTLARFHGVLQAAFGWTNSHLHVFEIGGERIAIPYELEQFTEGRITRSARLVTLGDVVDHGHRRFTYEYDFGDSWWHTIEVEAVLAEGAGAGWIRCLDGARACPPEDCGGPLGYAHLLEVLFDPRHPEFEEMRAWVGPGFEPDRFDLRGVNAALSAPPWDG